MFVPVMNYYNLVNKNIIYSDTVLPLKDAGENINITSIDSINENDFEKCFKVILEGNPNVIFNTVQYSKKNKKIYFYTDKKISTEMWDNKNKIKYKPLNNKKEILEEVKDILIQEKSMNPNYISLYDVKNFMKNIYLEFKDLKNQLEYEMNCLVEEKFSNDSRIHIQSFNYDNNELKISFNYDIFTSHYKDIIFVKKDNDLYLKESESLYGSDIFVLLSRELLKMCNLYIKYKHFRILYNHNIPSVNSNFLIGITNYDISIYDKKSLGFTENFELSYKYYDDYKYTCNSNILINELSGNEDIIFKKIFIRIDDCPTWSQNALYSIRKDELEKEIKHQKRLELKRKIFPWIKK